MSVESNHPPILDLSRPGGSVAVEVDVSEAAELLMSMCALASMDLDTLDLGRGRLEQLRADASPELLREVDELLVGSEKVPAHLLGLVYESPRPRTVDAFMSTLEATSAVDIRLNLLDYHNTGHRMAEPEVMRAAAAGDASARATLLEAVTEWGSKALVVERLLEVSA